MIGYDDIQGAQRFIVHDALTGGVNVITALIGIFAIPQVIEMFAKGRAASAPCEAVAVVRPQPLGASIRKAAVRQRPRAGDRHRDRLVHRPDPRASAARSRASSPTTRRESSPGRRRSSAPATRKG